MKMYQRIEHYDGYDIIATVSESGEFNQVNVCSNGAVFGEYKNTIFNMGWSSISDFLDRFKGRFKPITF